MVKNEIALLSKETIDKIAAGEVVERPSSVVKELVENAIDAGSTAVTVEIKEGGTTFIRITDNGCGISKEEIPLAFLRHSTSKIRSAEDLHQIHSLGFRGEALSSISAVSRVELITKTADELTGVRYVIEGAQEISMEEIGAPEGTTFLIHQLFYNTPVRKKFLKTPATEGSYINDLMERLALSHPEIAFRFINNGQEKINTSGNGNLRDIIYQIYGRDITGELLEVSYECEQFAVNGYIGKPVISRGNRNYENFFVQHRFVKSSILSKAVEDGFKGFMMQHQYPFVILNLDFAGSGVDVNVHPTKLEVRFEEADMVYNQVQQMVHERLLHRETIDVVRVEKEDKASASEPPREKGPEPFEKKRLEELRSKITAEIRKDTPYERKYEPREVLTETIPLVQTATDAQTASISKPAVSDPVASEQELAHMEMIAREDTVYQQTGTQMSFLSPEAAKKHKIIGQVFDTYWLVEFGDKLYIIDQHAAHEKVLFERTMNSLQNKEMTSQLISPPIIVSLTAQEILVLEKYEEVFNQLGYVITSFGGKEYSISGIPGNLFGINARQLFMDLIAECSDYNSQDSNDLILEKVASMSCKAAIKGNQHISREEVTELIDELLTLENPYHCPHGRPTIVSMTRYELDKKFKRIV